MFARIDVDVVVSGSEVSFRFPKPLSVIALFVSRVQGDVMWQLMASEMTEVPAGEGTVSVIPLADAPPELIEMARRAEESALRRWKEDGPLKPALPAFRYGVVPPGYKEASPSVALVPGEYELSVVTDLGEGSARFRVPVA